MAIVTVNQGESIESALRRFKRKVMTEEIIKDAKKHAFFIPPGQKAKLKSALARKRNKKKGRMRSPARLVTAPCRYTAQAVALISPVVFKPTVEKWTLLSERAIETVVCKVGCRTNSYDSHPAHKRRRHPF